MNKKKLSFILHFCNNSKTIKIVKLMWYCKQIQNVLPPYWLEIQIHLTWNAKKIV